MKNYPEPVGRILDVIEIVLSVVIALLLCACVYFAFYFAIILLEAAR